jgi:hypothetical protein
MLTKVFPDSSEMQTAMWFMITTRDVKVTSRDYEKYRKTHSQLRSKTMKSTMKGKATYIDEDGTSYHLPTNDKLINELGLVHLSTGKCTFTDGTDNYYLDNTDPMIKELNLFSVNIGKTNEATSKRMKGKAYAKDKNGIMYHVSVNDDKYTSGELKNMNHGTVNVLIDGAKKKVSVEDFYKNDYDHINKGKVDVIDKDGKVSKIDKSSELIKNGDVEIYVSDNTRISSRKNILKYNKSCIGKSWMTRPDGKEEFVEKEKVDGFLCNGWVMGRKSTKFKGYPTNKGKRWVNNDIKEVCILSSDLDDYLESGWIKGRFKRVWVNKNSVVKQILKVDLDNHIDKGWKRGRK